MCGYNLYKGIKNKLEYFLSGELTTRHIYNTFLPNRKVYLPIRL